MVAAASTAASKEGRQDGAAAPRNSSGHKKRRLPFSQVLAFTVTNMSQGIMLTLPFTVAVFLVRAFLAADAAAQPGGISSSSTTTSSSDEAQIGRLTGLLASVYSFAQFSTSYAWGVFSSRFGRKPVMLIGSAASSVTLLLFGLAGSFSTAAAARVVAGLLNGIIVAWKSSIGESCDALEQGRVLSYMSLSWGIGCILGPSIGGVTSMPCKSLPSLPGCQPGGLLQIRPYFLPCAISAAINFLAFLLNVFVLQETLPHLVAARQQQRQQQGELGSSSSLVGRLQAAAARVQAAASRLLLQVAGRRPTSEYGRVSSEANTVSSICCGPGCTGCSVCWQLWRTESGLVHGGRQQQQPDDSVGNGGKQQQQLYQLRPLLHEDSAGSLQLAALKPQLQQPEGADQLGSALLGSRAGRVLRLRPNDSVSEQYWPAVASSKQQPGQTLDSMTEQQQHQQDQQAASSPTRDTSSSSIDQFGSSSNSGDDCTIIVSSSSSPRSSQQHLEDGSTCCSTTEQQQHQDLAPLLLHKQQQSQPQPQQQQQWYRRPQVIVLLLAYGTVCLLFCAIDELTPIFASAPRQQGGLKLTELQLSAPLAFGGACLIVVSLFAFPAAQRAWGTLAVTRAGLLIAVLAAMAVPCTSFFGDAAAWPLLYLAMLLKAVAGCFAFTGTMISVNTSVSDPQELGAVNGVGQSLASLARGVGPAAGGLLWGVTVHLQGHVRGVQLLPFAVVAGTAVVALVLYAFVRPADAVEVVETKQGTSCCQE